MFWTFALALQAAVPLPQDANITQIPLVAIEEEKGKGSPRSPKSCTEKRDWCLTLNLEEGVERDRHTLFVDHGTSQAEFELPDSITEAGSGLDFWKFPITYQSIDNQDTFLFGIVSTYVEGYSGGGAEVKTLYMFRAEVGKSNSLIITPLEDPVPLGGYALIRACFGEADMKLRQNICHDDYALDVTIKPTGAMVNHMPELSYISQATVTPGFASRSQDNSDDDRLKRMKPKDFEMRTDDRCSYTVKMRADVNRARYATNFLDCSEFTASMQ